MTRILFASLMMLTLTSLNFSKKTHKPMMLQSYVEIKNATGLDARACSKLSQFAAKFRCGVWLTFKNKRMNGREAMGIMMLQAKKGDLVHLEVEGEKEEECYNGILALIDSKFGEKE